MRIRIGLSLAVLALALPLRSAAAGTLEQPSAEALEILALSGADAEIRAIASDAIRWIDAHGVAGAERRRIDDAIRQNLDGGEIVRNAALRLSASSDRSRAHAVLAWLRSEGGRAIARAESRAASAGVACDTQPERDGAEREASIRRVDALAGISRRGGERVRVALGSLLRGAADELASRGGVRRGALTTAAQDELLASLSPPPLSPAELACVYRDVATAELEAYVGFLRSPAGSWYREVGRGAVERALGLHAEEAGRHLAASLLPEEPEAEADASMQALRR